MSNTSWILAFITFIALMFSPSGFVGASLQLMLVMAVAVSVLKDMKEEDE